MDDLISRQAAIDAMDTWDKFGCDPNGMLVRYDDDKHYVPYVHYDDMVHVIKSLPSAQPEPCEDAVSRKAVYEAMIEKGQHSRRYRLGETWELNGAEIREALDTVPSVAPKQKTGKWVFHRPPDGFVLSLFSCDQCGYVNLGRSKYCPNCGEKMEGANGE